MSDLTVGGYKLRGVRLTYMLDGSGREFGNSPVLAIRLEGITEAYNWPHRFNEEIGLFYAIKDGLIHHHHHDGTSKNLGGYSNRSFEIPMEDGTKQIIRGPWFSERGVSEVAGEPTIDVTIYDDQYKPSSDRPDDWGMGTFGCSMTLTKVSEIIHLARPVDGKGSSMFRAIPVVIDKTITFAIMKDGSLWRRPRGDKSGHTDGLVLTDLVQ